MAAKVSAHILGYWMVYKTGTSDFVPEFNEELPTYQAAQAFEQGLKYYLLNNEEALRHFNRAVQLDSTFGTPWGFIIDIYTHRPAPKSILDSVVREGTRRFPGNRAMKFVYKKIGDATIERDSRRMVNILSLVRKAAPNEPTPAYHYSSVAAMANLPEKSIEVAEQFLPDENEQLHLLPVDYNHMGWLAHACNLTGQWHKTIDLISNYTPASCQSTLLHGNIIRALVREEETERLENYIEEVGEQTLNIGRSPFFLHLLASWESTLLKKDQESERHAEKALAALKELTPEAREWFPPYCHLLLGNLDEAEQGFLALEKQFPEEMRYKAMLGIVYSKMVEQNKAYQYLRKLEAMEDDWGWKEYWLANLQAQLGRKKEAIDLLEVALDKGVRFIGEGCPYFFWNMFQFDIHLMPLFEEPVFQKLVAQEG